MSEISNLLARWKAEDARMDRQIEVDQGGFDQVSKRIHIEQLRLLCERTTALEAALTTQSPGALVKRWRDFADELSKCEPPSFLAQREVACLRQCANELESLALPPAPPQAIGSSLLNEPSPIGHSLRRDLAVLLDNLYGLHVRPGHLDAVMDAIQLHSPVKLPVTAPPQGQEPSRDDLIFFLERRGYRRCDIAACNCNSYHGGHSEQRISEVLDVLRDADQLRNGETMLTAVQRLAASPPAQAQEQDDDVPRIIAFCRQVAEDGILPSRAWFTETADALAALPPSHGWHEEKEK